MRTPADSGPTMQRGLESWRGPPMRTPDDPDSVMLRCFNHSRFVGESFGQLGDRHGRESERGAP
ncbi:MAG: hypothetical protein ACREJ5_04095 [Geminicoccaceae bacterium]